jgi:hypothetical protein
MTFQDGSVGQLNFVQRHGLWSEEQAACVARIQSDIKQYDLRTIRIAWGDQHGIVRGKNVMAHDFLLALKNGVDFQTATLFMDTTNNFIAPLFSSDAGLGMTSDDFQDFAVGRAHGLGIVGNVSGERRSNAVRYAPSFKAAA